VVPNRVYAAFKFFLYTLFGSLLFLVAAYLFIQSGGSFSILDWHKLPIDLVPQIWIFLAFLIAFAVKVPMWPVHTWLPDAHVEAPTGGSIVLAAIALKLGAYGFLRFSLPIAPDASHELAGLVIALSLIAVVYIGFVALVQSDMKKLVAYSSIAHMGFVTLGFFMFSALAIEGALVQMISHGFISGAMFFCIGVMYDRMHSRQIADYGGVVNTMPKFAALFMLFSMANAGLPATSGSSASSWSSWLPSSSTSGLPSLAATSLILGAAYSLWMYKRVIFGAIANSTSPNSPTSTARVCHSGRAGRLHAVDGSVSATLHRSHARLGQRPAASRGRQQDSINGSRHVRQFRCSRFLPAAPEIFLAAMAMAILMIDLFVKDSRRTVTFALTQLTLLGCAAIQI
jgi:NADH-quinone oxidoreductase subunit M